MEKTQQPGEILSPDQSTGSIAALLRPFGASISNADASQHTTQAVCKLLQVYPANERLSVRAEGNEPPLPNSVDERGRHD